MRKVTAVSGGQPYLVEIGTDIHKWTADEPLNLGGSDIGPSPHDLLLGAVGACMTITARMYAARKGWPLESIEVELDFAKVRAEDCKDCATETGFVSEISIRASLQGDLDDSQRRRILEIAGRCPVKRALEGEIKIRSELV